MPRNIEYFIENKLSTESINKTEFIELLLTTSIASGINPPPKILQQYRTNYGFDNVLEFDTNEALQTQIKNLQEKIKAWKNKLVSKDEELIKELIADFIKKRTYWNEQKEEIIKKKNNLESYIQKLEIFSTLNEKQKQYKESLLIYLNNYKKEVIIELDELFVNYPNQIKYDDFINEQIVFFETRIWKLENYIKYDESFFNEIINLWFPKKNE